MKYKYWYCLILWLLLPIQIKADNRKILFDNGWLFFRGTLQAEGIDFDDSGWRIVNLPHDWSIEPLPKQCDSITVGPFSKESIGGFATGQTVGGEGWYRKSFVITENEQDLRRELYFEGIYNQAEIWVNGHYVYRNVYGYTSFRVDITPYCRPSGQKNVIAVHVLNKGKNSRWYTGSGIYRHVWMIKTNRSFINDWGTFIRTDSINNDNAFLSLNTFVINGGRKNPYCVQAEILDQDGLIVAQQNRNLLLNALDSVDVSLPLQVSNPHLWSVDTPYLYTLRIRLWEKNILQDEYKLPIGIRTIRFSVDKGFELNGKSFKLRGGCVHHDNGLLGAVAFDCAELRKLKLLKANGFNAVRTAHNPMSESFMNICDSLGLLVIDEAFDQWEVKKNPQDYHLYFKEWSTLDIRSLVMRDRNHPSVIMWSIGNEIRERISERGCAIAEYLKHEIRKYDDTRPITAGVNKYWNKERTEMLSLANAYKHLDVVGHNYMWRFYDDIHEEYPQQVMYGSESVAKEAAGNWDVVEKYSYVIGDFIWAAQDYLGEAGIGNSQEITPKENVHQFMGWPWFNAWCGDLDLLGVKKPQSYYRDVLWRRSQIEMAVEEPITEGKIRKVSFWGWPEEKRSWTFPGKENQMMTVNVYTREPRVRLYLNGYICGEQPVDKNYKATFQVPYQPGELKAVTLNEDGKEGAATSLSTVGKAVALRLVADKTVLVAGGQDLAYILIELIDAESNIVDEPERTVCIHLSGDGGQMIAGGNASPTDMRSFRSLTPKLFNGRAMLIVRSSMESGRLNVTVETQGLKTKINLITKTYEQE